MGKKAPKTLEEFCKIKYNKNNEWSLFRAYATAINNGELTPLADFSLYKSISKEIDDRLVGTQTANGIKITGKSNHFISRVIGSVEQRRNGVSIDDIISALQNPEEIAPIRINKNGNSQKYKGINCMVTINPDTGNLIQVNPRKKGTTK